MTEQKYMVIHEYMGNPIEVIKNLTWNKAQEKKIELECYDPAYQTQILEMIGRTYTFICVTDESISARENLTLTEAINEYVETQFRYEKENVHIKLIQIFNIIDDPNIKIELDKNKERIRNFIIEREEKYQLETLIKKYGIPENFLKGVVQND